MTVPHWTFKPTVSVLVPVFNHGQYLKKSIESIVNQGLESKISIKIKILNDGSTQDIQTHIKDILELDIIQYREKENEGLATTLDKLYEWELLDDSPSDFLTWHSADNIYLKNSLSTLCSHLHAYPELDFTYSNVQLINDAGDPINNSEYRKNDQTFSDKSILNLEYPCGSLLDFSDNFINACFLERRSSANISTRFKKEHNGFEDYIHWLDLACLGKGAHIGIKDALYQYRLHSDSLTEKLEITKNPNNTLQSLQNTERLKAVQKNKLVEKTILDLMNREEELKQTLPKESPDHSSLCLEYQKIVTKSYRSLYGNEVILPGGYSVPEVLLRARNRYLGLFQEGYKDFGRAIILLPNDISSSKKNILNLIHQNKDLGLILFASSELTRSNADSIYLESNLSPNLRIVDCRNLSEPLDLLNSLGSVDCVFSVISFMDKIDTSDLSLLDQLGLEIALSAATKRPIFAPITQTKQLLGPLPNCYPWHHSDPLPKNIPSLKNDLTNAHLDSILRLLSPHQALKKQIYCLSYNMPQQ